jgi:hypothetical protein
MGYPDGKYLGVGYITAPGFIAEVPNWTTVTITLTSAATLIKDQEYAVVIQAYDYSPPEKGNKGESPYIHAQGITTGTYIYGTWEHTTDAGVNWTDETPADLWFQTFYNTTYRDQYGHAISELDGATLDLYSNTWAAQTYIAYNTYPINKVRLRLSRSPGDASYIIAVSLQACDSSVTAPGQATNPFPANAATTIGLNISSMTWDSGGDTDYYKVYTGQVSGDLTWIASTVTALDLASYITTIGYPLDYNNTWYWRIDAVNTDATTTGVEWSFTTLKLNPPSLTGYYAVTKQFYRLLPVTSTPSGWGSVPGVGVEGYDYVFLTTDYFFNIINTNKKLITAANSAIWYEI